MKVINTKENEIIIGLDFKLSGYSQINIDDKKYSDTDNSIVTFSASIQLNKSINGFNTEVYEIMPVQVQYNGVKYAGGSDEVIPESFTTDSTWQIETEKEKGTSGFHAYDIYINVDTKQMLISFKS